MIVEIEKAIVGYKGDNSFAIGIKKFYLKKSNIYFLLGKSGSGKSTFLEALGLMNNTFLDTDSGVNFTVGDEIINMADLWSNEKKISDFRNAHLSFIFQSTNLMDNFTVGQNMAFASLINGNSLEDSENRIFEIMSSVNLDKEIYSKYPQNLSGGQRQRAAFVRAFLCDFKILFGDEPTGNLDEETSEDLMDAIKKRVKQEGSTAIIVSHNLDLALKYADEIYTVGRSHNGLDGEINSNRNLIRNNGQWWVGGEESNDPKNYLKEQINCSHEL